MFRINLDTAEGEILMGSNLLRIVSISCIVYCFYVSFLILFFPYFSFQIN